ncbi:MULTISPECIES: inovirus-type Gp2 protein [Paraburkholderia]|uniref:Inovirus Gp2 family protein n=1 Tax=Paraburkholderia madseniana TaxID=2599607 RepID=A0AAP5BCC1_9BURK|nr:MULTISPECIES: inovirus-type Gp2 protein [Paraburkholderia]MCX4146892.1 inovirus-type Gp2 protein [Paraburkholderia madseniana]MDN7149838.1 inovirus Gp2 family protein [Paraburkholderia sp. WS6]MDQ6408718.1 inovirus Gp2 family protein [Paraburkholderia madseniana]
MENAKQVAKLDMLDQTFEQIAQNEGVCIGHRTRVDRNWKTGDYGWLFKRLIKFTNAVLYSKLMPFNVERNGKRTRITEASHLASFYKYFHQYMDLYWKGQSYSPDIELFFECFNSHPKIGHCVFQGARWELETGLCEAEVFNDFVEYMRREAIAGNVKKRMADWKAVLKDEAKSIREYVTQLGHAYSKTLAVRVDMGYLTVAPNENAMLERTTWETGDASAWSALRDAELERAKLSENGARIDVKAALDDRNRFFKNPYGVDKDLFEHMTGYILKLERSDDGPLHFHCLFFFDGQKVQNIKYWVKRIERYWKKITQDCGYVHNCHINPKKDELEQKGRWAVGQINGNNRAQVGKLARYAEWYFTKDGQRVRVKPKVKSRLLTMGIVRKKRLGGPGRPRKAVKRLPA